VKITGCEAFIVTLPLRREHVWAGNTRRRIGRHLILRLDTDADVSGWGESPAIPTWGGSAGRYGGESPETVGSLISNYFMEVLRGADPRELGTIHRLMDSAVKGAPYAKAAIDIACYDIAGKALGVPVSTLLGGRHRAGVRIAHSLGLMNPDRAIAEAEQAAAEGITAFKIKTGLGEERDVELVRRMREALGPEIDLRVDANEGYATVGEAVRITRRQQEYNLLLCEQPMMGADALAAVAARIDVPMMADESAWTAADILDLNAKGAAECFSCYVTKPGGLWRARQQAEAGNTVGMYSDIGGSIEFGIATAANLHLGVALERAVLPSVCSVTRIEGFDGPTVGGVYYTDDIITQPHVFRDGVLLAPEGPGLGVEVDLDKLLHYSEGSVSA
jgi:muconate cycloisomerase